MFSHVRLLKFKCGINIAGERLVACDAQTRQQRRTLVSNELFLAGQLGISWSQARHLPIAITEWNIVASHDQDINQMMNRAGTVHIRLTVCSRRFAD